MARTPIRTEAPAPVARKVRLSKNANARSVLDIPQEEMDRLRAEGVDLMWVADSILGQPSPASRNAFEINAWEPVTPDMFGGMFEGRWTKRGHKGEINYEGLVLMWRPMELTIEARQEEFASRNAALQAQNDLVMGGAAVQGLPSGFETVHPTVHNKISRSIHAPMDIPKD